MRSTNTSVLIVGDIDSAAHLTASVLRLGYRDPTVLSLADAAARGPEAPALAHSLTILALSTATDDMVELARVVAAQRPSCPMIAVVTTEAAGVRVRERLPVVIPVVQSLDDRALVMALGASQQAVDMALLDVRQEHDPQRLDDSARLHEVLRRGKREWEATFDAIGDPIAVFDSHGGLLRGNTALAALLGRSVTDLPQMACHSIGLCGGAFPSCAVGEALASGTAVRADLTRAGGEIFHVTTFPVLGEGGGPSVVQVAKNVTDEIRSARRMRQMSEDLASANGRLTATVELLKSTQAQLLQAEKLSAIGQLVAGVAHELNNPLTSVMGYAQLLEDELLDATIVATPRLPSELAQDLRRIVEEAERAARIVRNLLAFARRQAVERVPHDLGELVARVVALRAYDLRLNGVTLETSYEPLLPPILADAGQIQQAILNLILNAEQAMNGRPGPRLSLLVRFDELSSAIEFVVSDTGHGIEVENLRRIFDPFFTTRDVGDGTGLGLSICYGIIREHGGQIDVESDVDAGARFAVLLPACAPGRQPAAGPLLVAHTDQGERDFLCAAFVAWGFTVSATGERDEALARYRAGGLHAVIVERGIIADDVPGWAAARTADGLHTPLILLARAEDDPAIDGLGHHRASATLTPPYQLRSLRSAIRAVTKEYV